MTPHEQLNADAEKLYPKNILSIMEGYFDSNYDERRGFIAGALSTTAANGCNKHVEIAKREFAIMWIESFGKANVDLKETYIYKASILELNQQLETLKQQP